jgi:hypothetical protein
MLNADSPDLRGSDGPGMPLLAAADLQDHLMTASHDLDRLQSLLSEACDTLIASFHAATGTLAALRDAPAGVAADPATLAGRATQQLASAVTALQFQDMASQLIQHTNRRLRNCADRIARETMGDDEDGMTVVEEAPLRPNPVTQDEMDAGSVELF